MKGVFYIDGCKVLPCKTYQPYGTTEDGKVFNTLTKKAMKQRNDRGYPILKIAVSGGKYQVKNVHLLVADAWLTNPDPDRFTIINHKDGVKTNNHYSNLEWCTPSQNNRHCLDTQLKKRCQHIYNASITNEQAHEVCKLLADGWRSVDISKKLDISKPVVKRIHSGICWAEIRSQYDIDYSYRNNFSVETVKWVCEQLLGGLSAKQIVDISTNKSLSETEVYYIANKIRYKEISDLYF